VAWWREYRVLQRERADADEAALVTALADLYAYVYQRPVQHLLAPAQDRAMAMRVSDAWVADGCRIDFELHYDFDRTPMALVARPVFDRIANTLVDRFVARADAIYAPQRQPAGPGAGPDASPPPIPDQPADRSSPA